MNKRLERLFHAVPVVLALALPIALAPGAAFAQSCLGDPECSDGNACTDDLCATTTNLSSLWFDGNDDRVRVSDWTSLNPTSGITLSAWIRLDAVGSRQAVIDKAYTSDAEPWYQYHLEVRPTGQLYFALAVNGVRKSIDTSGFSVGVGVWHHLAGTWDGATMRLYLDGVPYGSSTSAPGTLSVYARDLYVGSNVTAAMDLGGRVDEVAIYGRGLSADEVRSLMGKGLLDDPELRGRWALDEGIGSLTVDSSGNDNHGQITGALWNGSGLVNFGTKEHCFFPPVEGLECDDGLWCTWNDRCAGGACSGLQVDCQDIVPCTLDVCDELNDGCAHIPQNDPCADADPCTTDRCEAGAGCVNSPCDDGNPCTDDVCNPGVGCDATIDDTNSCSDGDVCNGQESCSSGTCLPGIPIPGEIQDFDVLYDRPVVTLTWRRDLFYEPWDVAVGAAPDLRADGGIAGAACLFDDMGGAGIIDLRPDPPPGTAEYYLVRSDSAYCGPGTWGRASDGTERLPVNACP